MLVKKILTYSIIAVAIALSSIVVAAGYLVLVPNSSFFGYSFIMGSSKVETVGIIENVDDIETLNINTHKYDVIIDVLDNIPTSSNSIWVDFGGNPSIITKCDITEFSFEHIYEDEDKSLNINIIEPQSGIIISKKSRISIGIPKSIINKFNVNIKTSGSDIIIGRSDSTTNSGQETILEIGDLNIENSAGRIIVRNTHIKGNVNITNTAGRTTFYVNPDRPNNLNIMGNVEINTDFGSFNFNDSIDINKDLVIRGNNVSVKVGTVNGGLDINSTSGFFSGNQLNDIDVLSTSLEFNSNKVLGNINYNNAHGNLNIKQHGIIGLNNNFISTITTNTASVTIEESYFNLNIETKIGNVNLYDSYAANKVIIREQGEDDVIVSDGGSITVTTDSGDIFLKLSDLVEDVGAEPHSENPNINVINFPPEINLETRTEGNIDARALQGRASLRVSNDSTSLSRIDAEFINVFGVNEIIAGRRNVNVRLNPVPFGIIVETISGDINLDLLNYSVNEWEDSDYNDVEKKYQFSAFINTPNNDRDRLSVSSTTGNIIISQIN